MERVSLLVYFISMLVWQIAGIGVVLSENAVTAGIFYRIYMPSSTGFLYCLFPLALSLTNRKSVNLITVITLIFYAAHIILSFSGMVIEKLYMGAAGFYVPELSPRIFILNLPVMIFMLAGMIVGIAGMFTSNSAVKKNRLGYYLTATGIIYIGLTTNLTFLQDYPVDMLSGLLGGLILTYSVLRRRPLGLGKLFFRIALHLVFIIISTAICLMLILLFAVETGNPFPGYSVFPVLVINLVLAIIFFRCAGYSVRENCRRIVTPENLVYRQNLGRFTTRFRKAVEFSEIYIVYRDSLIDYFPLSGMMVFLHERDRRDFNAVYAFGVHDHDGYKNLKIKKADLVGIFADEGFILADEPASADKITMIRELVPFSAGVVPDIIVPLKINEELIGFAALSFRSEKGFAADDENLKYLGMLSEHAVDAISRASIFQQLEDDVFNKGNLIKDINHRVKNNLQMISGLLSMQSLSTDNPEAKDILDTASGRISTISRIHEMLYVENSVDKINLKSYVEEMIKGFKDQGNGGTRIRFEIEIEELEIEPDTALTFCLAINELITNSVKYAFKGRALGVVRISISSAENNLHCIISDNGDGFNTDSADLPHSPGLGHRLVENFIVKQLDGTWDMSQENGIIHDITIPV